LECGWEPSIELVELCSLPVAIGYRQGGANEAGSPAFQC